MPRPKAEQTRKRILTSASSLFARQGVGRTSVREIAAAANVNLALVSHHFGGKDKLYAACIEAMDGELEGMTAELLVALSGGGSLADTIRDAVIRGFHYGREHRDAVRLIMRHVLDTGEVPSDRRTDLLLPFLTTAASTLSELTGRTPDQVRLIIQSLMFLMTRYALSSVEELALVAGMRGTDASQTHPDAIVLRRVEEQLGNQALWLFGLDS